MPTALPIDEHIPRVVDALKSHGSLVLVAQPGAGKTTRVPPAIVRAGFLLKQSLVMLQPRRIAARAAAERIAEENSWRLGEEVGYHIRFEKRIGPRTRIRVLTEGILTRQLLADPYLSGVGAVVLDEFHERSIHSDLALGMLREIQSTVRPDLKIVVMSATMDALPVAKFLGDCPVIDAPGRTFPVEKLFSAMNEPNLIDRVAGAVEREWKETAGDVLVFLPGAEEIRRVGARLAGLDAEVLPLYGSLPFAEQARALRPAQRRKIILATNIAETSLTIDGVTLVIDSGLARILEFDVRRGMDRLELQRISRASAVQRAGRAGRTRPGKCARLWSAKEHAAMAEHESPEIVRVDLCGAVLDVFAWGNSDPLEFGWFEKPPVESVGYATRLLEMLGALKHGKITDIGRELMKIPAHPRLGRLLLASPNADGAAMAAILAEKDFLRRGAPGQRVTTMRGESDLLLRLSELDDPRAVVDPIALRQARQARDQFVSVAKNLSKLNLEMDILKLPLLAYPDRVCRRRASDPSAAAIVGGGGVRLAPESIVREHSLFLALDARGEARDPKSQAVVNIASGIEQEWLEELFPNAITRQREAVFDEARQRVVGTSRVRYYDLILSEDMDTAVDSEAASKALADVLRPRAAEIFTQNEAAGQFLARLEFLQREMPEQPWPVLKPAELLEEICRGKRSLEEIHRAPLADILSGHVQFPLDRLLTEHAPEAIEVPSGSRIKLQYATNQPPALAVRLQEIFGWRSTPRVAGGRVPIVLHLLGPNFRPVQITSDLASFWATTYFQVRKDMRVRYPKHSWPEDPLTAIPRAKGARKR